MSDAKHSFGKDSFGASHCRCSKGIKTVSKVIFLWSAQPLPTAFLRNRLHFQFNFVPPQSRTVTGQSRVLTQSQSLRDVRSNDCLLGILFYDLYPTGRRRVVDRRELPFILFCSPQHSFVTHQHCLSENCRHNFYRNMPLVSLQSFSFLL